MDSAASDHCCSQLAEADSGDSSQAPADEEMLAAFTHLSVPPCRHSVLFMLIARMYHETHSIVRKPWKIPSSCAMLAARSFNCYADDFAVLRAHRAFRSLHPVPLPDLLTSSAQREDLIDSAVAQCIASGCACVDVISQSFAQENSKLAEDAQHCVVSAIEIEVRLQELQSAKEALPSASFRSKLCCGWLATMAMRLTNGLPPKISCRLRCSVASYVASLLLAETGEGFHLAGIRYRAACDNLSAASCFARAVALKHGPSHAELSYMFIGNCSLMKDLPMANHLAALGAKLGCYDSKAALASCLRFCLLDEDRAVQLAQESAAVGNSWGCSELGLILQHGIGVERNIEQAVFYTQKAAHLGNAWARHNLGLMYAAGVGVEQNFCQAEQYALYAL